MEDLTKMLDNKHKEYVLRKTTLHDLFPLVIHPQVTKSLVEVEIKLFFHVFFDIMKCFMNVWDLYDIKSNILTLNVPSISESWIEIKIKLNFCFLTSLWCL